MDSGLSEYRNILDALFARTGSTARFGLSRTSDLLDLVGSKYRETDYFHVAGTNGKGSTVATLYALLRAKGLRVGRYTSPHLVDFRERIVVDDQEISEAEVISFLSRWTSDAERMGATFFEITTVLALDYFARSKVDVAVIETGLGGRLDATNVIMPVAAGITSISIDHAEYLGDTIESIAQEKAGIFKRGVPSVIGPLSTEARVAIYRSVASENMDAVIDASRLYRTSDIVLGDEGTTFRVECGDESVRLTTGLVGAVQADNAMVALAMLKAAGSRYATSLDEAARTLPDVRLPGRFQRHGKFILDVAHNPDGMRCLTATIKAINPASPVVAVLGILADKDWRSMMQILSEVTDSIVLTQPPSAPRERSWKIDEALAFGHERGLRVKALPSMSDALRATANVPTAVITGSFHTVGDAMEILKSEVSTSR